MSRPKGRGLLISDLLPSSNPTFHQSVKGVVRQAACVRQRSLVRSLNNRGRSLPPLRANSWIAARCFRSGAVAPSIACASPTRPCLDLLTCAINGEFRPD